MSPATGPSLYDVLDVDPGASTEEIREAWRAASSDLTPADRRFRLYSQAAEVLLDPERRAAYDAELAAGEDDETPAGGGTSETEPAGASRIGGAAAGAGAALGAVAERLRRRRSTPSADAPPGARWPLLALAVAVLLSLGLTAYLLTQPSPGSVDDAAAESRSAAERAIVPVLSYDHQRLDEDQQAAHDFLTDAYKSEYDRFFEGVVRTNAERTEAVVGVEVVSSAVVRASEDRAEILLFVDRPTTNKANEQPVVYKDQVRVRMAKVGDEWLVDCLITSAEGSCRS